MKPEELITFCTTLMKNAEIIVFTTIDDNKFPLSRAMFNLKNDVKFPSLKNIVNSEIDPFYTIIGTNTSSQKIKQIKANPHVTLYYSVPEKFHGLSLSGTIKIVDDQELKNKLWVDGWEIYYPQGPTDPDYTVLQLQPMHAEGWYGGGKYAFTISYNNGKPEYEMLQL